MSGAQPDHQLIAPDVKLGRDLRTFGFVNLHGCEIDAETKIRSFREIQKGAKVDACRKISSDTLISESVALKDGLFLGHGVAFIDDRYPRTTNGSGAPKTEEDWSCEVPIVEHGASIVADVTFLGGITVRANGTGGASSVVTNDMPPNATVAANSAVPIETRF